MNDTFTITFSECVENHVGMQKIGEKREKGFTTKQLKKFAKMFEEHNLTCELINLSDYIDQDIENATVLIVRDGVKFLTNYEKLENELRDQIPQFDKKALMRGRVVNKHARWNLCYADDSQEPNYENGKGRVIAFDETKYINRIRKNIGKFLKEENLYAELNYYYDIKKCGIGYHGDTERNLVLGCRVGQSMNMHWQWFHLSQPVGEHFEIEIKGGDFYIMADAATGNNWKKRSLYTLRHATGCEKYTKL